MNFLAHLYLSGDNEEIKLGNFIGDYIKGSKYLEYPEDIKKGIILHRRIDFFTDNHHLIKEASAFFKKDYGRYAGIVMDVTFDHFLASNWNYFSSEKLRDFTRNAHAIFLNNFRLLPVSVKKFLPFLIQSRRLESYATKMGLYKALELMARYTSLPAKQDFALATLEKNKPLLQNFFFNFMHEIILYMEEEGIRIDKPGKNGN